MILHSKNPEETEREGEKNKNQTKRKKEIGAKKKNMYAVCQQNKGDFRRPSFFFFFFSKILIGKRNERTSKAMLGHLINFSRSPSRSGSIKLEH